VLSDDSSVIKEMWSRFEVTAAKKHYVCKPKQSKNKNQPRAILNFIPGTLFCNPTKHN
jgi:hypothetical protein